LKLRCSLLKPAKQRNSLKNHEKRQALAGLSGPSSCKLPGSAFRDSLNRLPEKTIKLSTRQYTARLYTGGLDYADRLRSNMHALGTRTTVTVYLWPATPGRTNGGPGWPALRRYDERRGLPRLALQVSLQCFPHAALLPPVEDRSDRLKVVQRDRITASLHARQEQELLLDSGR